MGLCLEYLLSRVEWSECRILAVMLIFLLDLFLIFLTDWVLRNDRFMWGIRVDDALLFRDCGLLSLCLASFEPGFLRPNSEMMRAGEPPVVPREPFLLVRAEVTAVLADCRFLVLRLLTPESWGVDPGSFWLLTIGIDR